MRSADRQGHEPVLALQEQLDARAVSPIRQTLAWLSLLVETTWTLVS
jgi:hypothetical protein